MPTVRQIFRGKAENLGIPFWVVEKDYALSYLLTAISQIEGLGDQLVLKGGTALRKLYFPDYRFSEDLDYTTLEVGPIDDLDAKFRIAVERTTELFLERGPFQLTYDRLTLREPHPAGQSAFNVHVQFPYHRQPSCRLKVEITVDEPLLLKPERRSLLHGFPETLKGEAQVYRLSEITAEKLRALLQSEARVKTRGWTTSRIARDYYDLWYLLKHVDLSSVDIKNITQQKAAHRGIDVKSAEDFFTPNLIYAARHAWEKQLRIFVPTAPDVDIVLEEAEKLVGRLFK